MSRDMNPLLSVIIPVYKVETYLNRCIQSTVNQTYKNIEIILVDDGSPDKSPEICDSWKEKDTRIVVIHKKNGGLSSARNAGISIAQGDIIAFVDSDDYIDPQMYQSMIKCFQSTCAQIVCCGRYIKSETKEKKIFDLPSQNCFTSREALSELLVRRSMDEAAWDKIFKASLFEDIRFPEGEINEDIVIMPLLFSKCERITHIGKAFYYYWQNEKGITKSEYSSKQSVVLEHMKYIKQYIRSSYPELSYEESCFQGRYALDMLENLLGSSTECLIRYIDDYNSYMFILKNNLACLLRSNTYNLKFKLKGILLVLGVYLPIKRIVKKIFIFNSFTKGY